MRISVEVVYALPRLQQRVLLELPPGSTVLDAVQAGGLPQHLPAGQLGHMGVWGKSVTPETPLRDRDRVEIYRSLTADPGEVRRARAAKARNRA
jgi:putative ubiquitin-RnfH superfamily antitoxin RatB of RatAB toxin-antitoxin module